MKKRENAALARDVSHVPKVINGIEEEMSKIIVGQREIIHGIIRAILCDGHVLVEGVPGVAKTLIVKSIAKIMGCDSKRVQFTVDLLPTDITGIMSYDPKKGFEIVRGPIFTNFMIADEINRSPPKTQSALLEAMQEKAVTISRKTYNLPLPFFVMATENPLEVSGVYKLPEAQVDRFLFKLLVEYSSQKEEFMILDQNISIRKFEDFKIKSILNPKKIIDLQKQVKQVFASDAIKSYILDIVNETRNSCTEYGRFISYGASPRASIALILSSKAEALMHGRNYVIPSDVKEVAHPVLRHRLILNYEAEAEKISSDKIINHILNRVRAP